MFEQEWRHKTGDTALRDNTKTSTFGANLMTQGCQQFRAAAEMNCVNQNACTE